jgi:uncharacterized integral membrane protein (TIGR00698 family)
MTSPAATRLATPLFLAGIAFSLSPWASPPLALAAGMALGLTVGAPRPARTGAAARLLLQGCVVGLGLGMSAAVVLRAGALGLGWVVAGVLAALGAGLALGRLLRVERETSWLLTAGTSICGGSAIAAVGAAIRARPEPMALALGTVFILNAVALYLFPAVARLLGLSEAGFAVWAAVAIHDTSAVVGAAASYGPRALEDATVLKLVRTLWLLPLALGAAVLAGRRAGLGDGAPRARVPVPWFIVFFVLAVALRSLAPAASLPFLDGAARAARAGLVLALFLIGAGLTRGTLRLLGPRPLLQGVLLWALLAAGALAAVLFWVEA